MGRQRTQRIPGSAFGISLHPFWQIDNGFFLRPIMARTQILVRRWGPPEQGFRRCFAHGLYQSLVSSVAQATTRILKTSHLGKRHCRLFTRKVSAVVLIEAFSWSQNVKTSKLMTCFRHYENRVLLVVLVLESKDIRPWIGWDTNYCLFSGLVSLWVEIIE